MKAIGQVMLILLYMQGLMVPTTVHGEEPVPKYQAAIVIDDFGNNLAGTEAMMNLPFPITVAVMPLLPTTQRDAHWAHMLGHDVIVHLPMEPVRGKRSWLGPGAITTDLSDDEIRQRVHAAIDDVPHAIGMNNHMGSRATKDKRVMRIVLEVCKERGLFFMDSRTSDGRVIDDIAAELGVMTMDNDIFLDHIPTRSHMLKQIDKVETCAAEDGDCISIGHVGPSGKRMAKVLNQSFPMSEDVDYVVLSELMDVDMSPHDPVFK